MTLKIDSERYEELLDVETRVHVLIDKLKNDNFILMKDVCRILGYSNLANDIEEKERKKLNEFKKNNA